jgi:hypothetical protein
LATTIDHIILAVDAADKPALSQRLKDAGFVHGDNGKHPGGTANETVAWAGGAFLELLYEQSPGSSGNRNWWRETPRVQGVGFATDNYADDITTWGSPPGSWDRDFPSVRDDGQPASCRAAGPLAHENEFYVFYMDRPAPDFGDRGATAKLTDVTVRSTDPDAWREKFATWFRLPSQDGALTCDGVTFRFEPGDHEVRLSLTFEVPGGGGAIPIAGGSIELVAAPTGAS